MFQPTAFIVLITISVECFANEDAKRLFDDLMRDYNKLLRPVARPQDRLTIYLKLSLSQIIDINEKDQMMTTSVWLKQHWNDSKLHWDPEEYSGVNVLYVPSEMIWVPDIVLYNNADGFYNITIATKATIWFNGSVHWEPPAIYKSMCEIDVQWFPFDEQSCSLKFGSWSYDERVIDLQHLVDPSTQNATYVLELNERKEMENVSMLERGIDLSQYYPSVEWDLVTIPAKRHNRFYMSCCPETGAYVDIMYYIKLRRKPLFYTVNLIFPCVGISFLTILVFYLPSDSGEKITLCISILLYIFQLVSLTVFFLLLTEIIPATSVVLPLIGKYLLFTMIMVSLSVVITVITLNIHFRTPTTHRMPPWVKQFFLRTLPKYLFMRRPIGEDDSFRRINVKSLSTAPTFSFIDNPAAAQDDLGFDGKIFQGIKYGWMSYLKSPNEEVRQRHERLKQLESLYRSPSVLKAFDNICFIAELLKKKDKDDRIDEDWKYIAKVLDRLFLWIFAAACFIGTLVIFLQAPTFYDHTPVIPTPQDTSA